MDAHNLINGSSGITSGSLGSEIFSTINLPCENIVLLKSKTVKSAGLQID